MSGGTGNPDIGLTLRNKIKVKEIEKRGSWEKEPFEVLTATYNKLFDAVLELRYDILRLTHEKEKLTQDSLQQQNEPTEEAAPDRSSQIVNISSQPQETETNLNTKESRLTEAENAVQVLSEEKRKLEIYLSEIEGSNKVLREEHQALQIAYASIEEKLKTLHNENIALVEKLMTYKARDAEMLNEKSEHFAKLKQAQMQKELEKVGSEVKVINPERLIAESLLPSTNFQGT